MTTLAKAFRTRGGGVAGISKATSDISKATILSALGYTEDEWDLMLRHVHAQMKTQASKQTPRRPETFDSPCVLLTAAQRREVAVRQSFAGIKRNHSAVDETVPDPPAVLLAAPDGGQR